MADTYNIDKYDIRKMVMNESMDLMDEKVEEKEESIETSDLSESAKEAAHKNIYSTVGKELDPEFTGTTGEELLEFLVDKKMELFETQSGKISLCNQYIREYLNMDDGDAIQIGGEGYRNENLMFWSKTKDLIYPDYDINDYGTVPSDFRVGNGEGEFAPWHWKDVIEYYDGIIWPSNTLCVQIHSSLKEVPFASLSKKLTDSLLHTNTSKTPIIFCTEVILHDELVQVVSSVPIPKYFITVEKTVIEGYE
jgi:hypothetical protein